MCSASECVRRLHRQCLRRPTHSDAERTCRASGRLNFHRHIGRDKTVLSVSCLVCRCELDDCSERVQTSNFLSATVSSCRGSNSHRRDGRDTDKTVLSCLAWRCELALTNTTRTTRPCVRRVPHIASDKKRFLVHCTLGGGRTQEAKCSREPRDSSLKDGVCFSLNGPRLDSSTYR